MTVEELNIALEKNPVAAERLRVIDRALPENIMDYSEKERGNIVLNIAAIHYGVMFELMPWMIFYGGMKYVPKDKTPEEMSGYLLDIIGKVINEDIKANTEWYLRLHKDKFKYRNIDQLTLVVKSQLEAASKEVSA